MLNVYTEDDAISRSIEHIDIDEINSLNCKPMYKSYREIPDDVKKDYILIDGDILYRNYISRTRELLHKEKNNK